MNDFLQLDVIRARYSSLINIMDQGFAILELQYDKNGNPTDFIFIELNKAFERQTGISVLTALGRRGSEAIPGLEEKWLFMYDRITKSGVPERIIDFASPLGKWYEIYAAPAPCGRNRISLMFSNVSSDVLSQIELSRRANLINLSHDAIYAVDKDHHLTFWNKGAELLYGYTEEEALGKVPYELLKTKYPSEDAFINNIGMLMKTFKWEGDLNQIKKNGDAVTVLSRWSIDMENGEVLVTNTDITELRKHTLRAEYLATHDELTGLPNRRFINDRIDQAIEKCRDSDDKFAVILLDLDRFKLVNDSLGHHKGDTLLIEVANRLCKVIRKEDMVARLGGDEFVILIENMPSVESVRDVATKIIKCLSEPVEIEGNTIIVESSIGIAIFPDDGVDNHTLTRHADLAMYQAKELDKGSFVFYCSQMNDAAQERLQKENDLRRAFERKEFSLVYQAKVCSADCKTTGVEALIRWNHPTRGLVSPSEFIELSEEIGLIVPMGEWVLRTACQENKSWQNAGSDPIKVSVNLSIHQLVRPNIVSVIQNVLEETGLDPQWLDLEITESTAMKNVDQTIQTLQEIRNLGVSLSIDDFGTGFSSLAYLKNMPIDNLKIDQSFVKGIPYDKNDTCIVKSIIFMAHSMGLRVIAEGVTDLEQVAFLDTERCDEMQGYLFSRPLTSDEIINHIIPKKWIYPYE